MFQKNKFIYLHVGIHRTGTSSIQNFLSNNKSLLQTYDYLYPKTFASELNQHGTLLSFLFKKRFTPPKHVPEYKFSTKKKIKKLFRSEISENRDKNLIISGEDISTFSSSEIKSFKSFLYESYGSKNIKIIICLREPISHYISDLNHKIQHNTSPIKNIIRSHSPFNFAEIIFKFYREFKNVELLYYNSTNSPINTFMECIGLELKAQQNERVNISFPNVYLPLLFAHPNDRISILEVAKNASSFEKFNNQNYIFNKLNRSSQKLLYKNIKLFDKLSNGRRGHVIVSDLFIHCISLSFYSVISKLMAKDSRFSISKFFSEILNCYEIDSGYKKIVNKLSQKTRIGEYFFYGELYKNLELDLQLIGIQDPVKHFIENNKIENRKFLLEKAN